MLFRKPGEGSSCQCMWFHRHGSRPREEQPWSAKRRNEKNVQDKKRLVESGVPMNPRPCGWRGDRMVLVRPQKELLPVDRSPGYSKAPRGGQTSVLSEDGALSHFHVRL